jgi:hypothetical protein
MALRHQQQLAQALVEEPCSLTLDDSSADCTQVAGLLVEPAMPLATLSSILFVIRVRSLVAAEASHGQCQP